MGLSSLVQVQGAILRLEGSRIMGKGFRRMGSERTGDLEIHSSEVFILSPQSQSEASKTSLLFTRSEWPANFSVPGMAYKDLLCCFWRQSPVV